MKTKSLYSVLVSLNSMGHSFMAFKPKLRKAVLLHPGVISGKQWTEDELKYLNQFVSLAKQMITV